MISVSYSVKKNIESLCKDGVKSIYLNSDAVEYICKHGSISAIKNMVGLRRDAEICPFLITHKRFDVLCDLWGQLPVHATSVVESFIKILGIGYKWIGDDFIEVTEYDEDVFKIFVHFLAAKCNNGFDILGAYGPNVLKKIGREYAKVKTSASWPFIGDEDSETKYVTSNSHFIAAIIAAVTNETDIIVVEELLAIYPKLCTSKKRMTELMVDVVDCQNVVVFNYIADRYADIIEWRRVAVFDCPVPVPILERLYDMDIGNDNRRIICENIIGDGYLIGLEVIAKRPIPPCKEDKRVFPEVWDYGFMKRVIDLGFGKYINEMHKVPLRLLAKDINEGRMRYAKWMDDKFMFRKGSWMPRRKENATKMSFIITRYRETMAIPAMTGPGDVAIVCID